jgi:CHAD domain-containing protein
MPAPDLASRDALALLVRQGIDRLAALEPGIRADLDAEFLHDHRVALRRLRSLAGQLRAAWSERAGERLRGTLAGWQRASNRCRDLDVWLLDPPAAPHGFATGMAALVAALAAERDREQRALAGYLADPARGVERSRLLRLAERPPAGPAARRPVAALAAERTWAAWRKARRLAAALTPAAPDEAVHAVRLAVKKVRYLLEFAGPLVAEDGSWTGLRGDLRALQERLGAFNDAAVQAGFLAETSRRLPLDRDALLAAGAMIADRRRALDAARPGVHEALADLLGDAAHRRWRAAFRA